MTLPARQRLYAAALAAVLVATAAILIVLGSREFIGYDSFWHVFIARQDRWLNFGHEVRDNAHPPLFYLLLRIASAWFGSTLLAYRAVSIAAIVAATGLVAMIVRRITSNLPLAIVAAAAFGFAEGAIMVGLEVRAYALCAAFTLLSVVFYLDWLAASARRQSARSGAGFALAATAAVATHYSTFFFLAAAIGTPIALALISSRWRRRLTAKLSAHPLATALMFGIPLAAAATAYAVHVRLWPPGSLSYLPSFIFNPATETRWSFLVRNTLNLVAIVVPGETPQPAQVEYPSQALATAVIGAVSLLGIAQLGRARAPRLAAVPPILTAIMVTLNAAGGIAQRYPYGGVARHEFFLVPLALVGLFGLIETVRRGLSRPLTTRWLTTAVVTCGVAVSISQWTSTFRIEREARVQAQMDHFRRLIPLPQTVLLDSYTFINFFSHYHDWQWRIGSEWPDLGVHQVWRLSKGDRQMAICRVEPWSLDMTKAETYTSILECGQLSGASRVAIFRTHWQDASPDVAIVHSALAEENGLTATTTGSDGNDLYAEFTFAPGTSGDCGGSAPAPTNLHVVSNEHRVVVLAWSHSIARTKYLLEAGLGPGLSDSLSRSMRATTFTVADVTPATYYARVTAVNRCGISPPSVELRVVVK